MGRQINPKDEQWAQKEGAPKCGPGEKLLAAVGFERYKATTGSRMMSVRLICLRDLAPGGGDQKHEVFENFVLEDSSMWRFVKFVDAIGWAEPFDVDDDGDVEKILTHAYIRAVLKIETFEGKDRARVDRFLPAGAFDDDPDWAEWIEEGENRHTDYMAWRSSNPRGAQARGRSSGGGGGGGSRPAGGSTASQSRGGGHADDDIPF